MGTIRERVIIEGEERGVVEAAERSSEAITGIGSTLDKVAKSAAIGLIVTKLGGLATEAVNLAVDAEEAGSAFTTAFGSALPQVSNFVDEFANKAGFATFELQQMLAVTGTVIQGIGATEAESAELAETMARLAGDVASFSNASGGAQAVLGALQSAINGEREALKTYGLALSETEVQQAALLATGKTHADQLTRLEKAQATVTLAMEKAGKAMGDLDRTQDSAANQLRQFEAQITETKAAVGAELVPALLEVLPIIKDELLPAIGDIAVAAAELASVLAGPVATGLSTAAKGASIYATIAGGLVGIWDEGVRASTHLNLVLDGLADGMGEGMTITHQAATAMAMLAREEAINADTAAELQKALGATRSEMIDATEKALAWAEAKDLDTTAIEFLTAATRQFVDVNADYDQSVQASTDALQDRIRQTDILTTAEGDVAVAMRRTSINADHQLGLIRHLGLNYDTLNNRLREAEQSQRSLSSVLLAAADPVFGAVDAYQRYQDLLAEIDEDGERTAEEQLELARAMLETQASFDSLDPHTLELALQSISTALGISTDEARELLQQLGLLDGKTVTTVVDVQVKTVKTVTTASGSSTGFVVGPHIGVAFGGIVPGAPSQAVPAILHGGELVIPANATSNNFEGAAFRDLVATLARQVASSTHDNTQTDQSRTLNLTQNVFNPEPETPSRSGSRILAEAALAVHL